jgi:hypothetical protein
MTRGTGPENCGGRDELAAQNNGPVGKPHLPILLDSGSARSLISFDHFQQLTQGDPNLHLESTVVTCVTASGQSLEIVGQVEVRLKICRVSWSWVFLVSRRLRGEPIVGADFISMTKLVPDLGSSRCHFAFVPSVSINFIQGKDSPPSFRYSTLFSQARQVQTGKLSPF